MIDIKKKFIYDSIKLHAHLHPDKIALYDKNRTMTYSRLWENIKILAAWLSQNLIQGSRVGIMLNNSIEMVISLYAVCCAHMTAVPIDRDIHPRNLDYILKDSGFRLMITDRKSIPVLEDLRVGKDFTTLIAGPFEPSRFLCFYSLEDILQKTLIGSPDLISPQSPESTAVILYTTGTTGPKKGVMLSHINLNSAAENIIRFMELKNDIVEILPMPFSHSFGFGRLRCVLGVGGSAIIENGFLRPEFILGSLDKYQANAISSVPAGFAILLGFYPDFFRKAAPQIKYIEIGSDFMDLKIKKQLIDLCPNAKICMHYGLTEASRAAFLDFSRDKNFLETAGKSTHDVNIKIIENNGKEAKTCNPGEIVIRGDIVMKGYWNKPELTAETLKGGWLHTGDSGFLDKNGYLHLIGREEDIINIRGMKAAPGEIEEIIKQFKGICDAAVIGYPSGDKLSPVIIKAFIVVGENFKDLTSLKNHCINHLESYKIPQEFKIIKKIPRSEYGKILRNQLFEQFGLAEKQQ